MQAKFVKLSLVSMFLLAGFGAVTYAGLFRRQDGVVPGGVRVAGLDLGGKTEGMAREALTVWQKERAAEKLSLHLPAATNVQKKWTPTRSELGAEVDLDGTMTEALGVGKDKGALERFGEVFSGPKATEVPVKWKMDPAKLKGYLKKNILPAIHQKPADARFIATKDSFKIIPEKPGLTIDIDAASEAIKSKLVEASPPDIELPTTIAPPHITAADLKGIEGEISSFRTHYGETGNRAKNIQVACSHINGTVLKPGDKFSYNKTVGPRDEDGGFKMAPVIINGKLKPGMGGGVCQTSSTLYNAVLLADLKIVRREHHAFPVHYLPAGRDATVAYGDKDFQFENNTKDVIAISASGANQQVVMRIFGKKVPGREVAIERTNVSSWGPPTETVRDSSLAAGRTKTLDKGHAGHRVTVWRIVKMNGQVVKRETLSRDYYQTFPRLVAVGTHPVAPRPAPVSNPSPAPAPANTPPGGAAAPPVAGQGAPPR